MAKSFRNWKKTLQEKEKLLVPRHFSFSHSVFKRLVLQTRKNQGLFGKGLMTLNDFQNVMKTSIFFPTMFSTCTKIKPFILATFNARSDSTFNSDN